MYLYKGAPLDYAARDNETWNNFVDATPAITIVIDGLSFQDRDMNIMYTRGPNTTAMFYLSTKIASSDGSYTSVHRTFPGVARPDAKYNAAERDWFKYAPEDAYHMDGPYIETFTRQAVLTLSSMKPSSVSSQSLTIVSAAVMLISELASIGEESLPLALLSFALHIAYVQLVQSAM